RRDRAGGRNLAAVEHVLQGVAQLSRIPEIVLHLKHHAVELRLAERDRRLDVGRREGGEGRLAAFARLDDLVERRQIGPVAPLDTLRGENPATPYCEIPRTQWVFGGKFPRGGAE